MNTVFTVLQVGAPWVVLGAASLWLIRTGTKEKQEYVAKLQEKKAAEQERARIVEEALSEAAELDEGFVHTGYAKSAILALRATKAEAIKQGLREATRAAFIPSVPYPPPPKSRR